jgi:putative membrane protein
VVDDRPPLWIAVAIAIIAVNRPDRTGKKTPGEPTRLSPEGLLAERFANGDVDESEYLHHLSVLHPDSDVAQSKPATHLRAQQ